MAIAADLVLAVYCVVIATVALILNGILLILIVANKDLRRKDYICFILNRTLIEFSFCLTLAIIQPIAIINGAFFSDLCTVAGFFELWLVMASIYTEPILASNRFISIFYNNAYKKIFKPRNVYVICFAIWAVAFILTLPHLGIGSIGRVGGFICCMNFSPKILLVAMFANYVPLTIGLIVIGYCNTKIFRFLRQHQNQSMSNQQRSRLQTDREMSNFIIVAAIIPLFLEGPVVTMEIIDMFFTDTSDWIMFTSIAVFLLSFVANPLVTLFMVRPLRNEFNRIVRHVAGKSTIVPTHGGLTTLNPVGTDGLPAIS